MVKYSATAEYPLSDGRVIEEKITYQFDDDGAKILRIEKPIIKPASIESRTEKVEEDL